jgi:ABC-type multidrug transport system fused ATPase/permease subunit
VLHGRASKEGLKSSELSIKSNEKIVEVFSSYRESVVRNRRNFYAKQIGDLRFKFADVSAETQFLPNVSKYVIESGIVIGALIISGVQFALQDASYAIATLSVFLAAGTRIAPAIMRLQQSFITIKNSVGAALPTLQLIDSLKSTLEVKVSTDELITDHGQFISNILVESVSLKYPLQSAPALNDLSLRVEEGSSLAIVGPSGAGKTTLVDVILGVLPYNSGSVKISDMSPLDAIERWPGAISYVPQNVTIANGTFRSNVAFGYGIEVASDKLVWEALETAQLDHFVKSLPNQLDSLVSENGSNLSGGQKQRLGIARAMFTKPKLLVLDEATSALDAETEASISTAINELRGSTTIFMIAHRLSTVRNADLVVYLDAGKVVATGSFEDVRKAVPNFERQAKLMGL